MSAASDTAVSSAETTALFADLSDHSSLVLAVSGGPDSTALLVLAARWRDALAQGPKLLAVTIDHGLRAEARREAAAVKRLSRSLGVQHKTLCWTGRKPVTGLQEAARRTRYRLLAAAAKSVGSRHVLTAHTLDDQAETVLMRLARGSGVSGLAAMGRVTALEGVSVVRPLLDIRKGRLIATLREAGVCYADDPSNRDRKFTRVRFRAAMPALADEGLGATRLALLARRVRRAEKALEVAVDSAANDLAPQPWPDRGPIIFQADPFLRLPEEVALRLLGRAVAKTGDEGPVELGKLEALHAGLAETSAAVRFRRTLAGALVTRADGRLTVERAPARGNRAGKPAALTKTGRQSQRCPLGRRSRVE